MSSKSPLLIEFLDVYERAQLLRDWQILEAQTACSFFVSSAWISSWLATMSQNVVPTLAKISDGDTLVALALFGVTGNRRHFYLNESGRPELDVLAVEYNDFLCLDSYRDRVWPVVVSELFRRKAQSIRLSGFPLNPEPFSKECNSYFHLERADRSFQVSLDAVRSSASKSLLDVMTGNTRALLRKSLNRVGTISALKVEAARSAEESIAFFQELKKLHQARWEAKGLGGAFAKPFFEDFHTELIKQASNGGSVDLLKISGSNGVIGFLYNLKWKDSVLQYQGGFDYSDPKLQPGLLCHLAAVDYYARADFKWYDLLAGESRYKKSIAQESRELFWGELQRKTLSTVAFRLLRAGKKWCVAAPTLK